MSKIRSISFIFIYTFALMLSIAVPAGASGAVPIAEAPADEQWPTISGDRVVWQNDYAGKSVIYGVELGSTPTRLTNPAGNDRRPRVDGDIAVFERRSGTGPVVDSDIWMYRFSTGAASVVSGSPNTKYGPDVSGDKAVWYEFNGPTGWDIMIKDLSTGGIYRLTESPSKSIEPRISGDIVVWSDDRYGQFDIFYYNLSVDSDMDGAPNYRDGDRPAPDPAIVRITTDPSKQSTPDVSGRKVVWTDWRDAGDIYYYDLDTPVANGTAIAPAAAARHSAEISGNLVAWVDWRNGDYVNGVNSDIYLADLASRRTSRITTNSAAQSSPSISGARLVWADDRNGTWDIYMEENVDGNLGAPDVVAPVTTLSAPSVSTKTSKTTKFKVSWSGADQAPSSGIAKYDVQSAGVGGTWNYWKKGTTATEGVFAGKVGKTYYFRARAKDRAGNLGVWSAVKRTIVPYDDSSPILKKRRGFNGFESNARSKNYRGTLRSSTKRGDFLRYRFSGESVSIIAALSNQGARAKVYIDGKFVSKINTYKPKRQFRKIVFSRSLTNKAHVMKIVNLATGKRPRLEIDGIAVGR